MSKHQVAVAYIAIALQSGLFGLICREREKSQHRHQFINHREGFAVPLDPIRKHEAQRNAMLVMTMNSYVKDTTLTKASLRWTTSDDFPVLV